MKSQTDENDIKTCAKARLAEEAEDREDVVKSGQQDSQSQTCCALKNTCI